MPNPILQALNPKNNPMINVLGTINQIKQILSGKSPEDFMRLAMDRNPQFAKFIKDNQGKSPEEIARDYGLDWTSIQKFLK